VNSKRLLKPTCWMMVITSLFGIANAALWTVGSEDGKDFKTIQEAINAASQGDTIEVNTGKYFENVVVNKKLTLRGIGEPEVDAMGRESAITLHADGILLEGFNATNSSCIWLQEIGGALVLAGIRIKSSHNVVKNNKAVNNCGPGIALYKSKSNEIYDNLIEHNFYHGIFIEDSSFNTIENNILRDNKFEEIFFQPGRIFDNILNDISGNTIEDEA
jgi:parallel beta-helix repeat protein